MVYESKKTDSKLTELKRLCYACTLLLLQMQTSTFCYKETEHGKCNFFV